MAKYCTNCGQIVQNEELFCKNCGMKTAVESSFVEQESTSVKPVNLDAVNKKINLQNTQSGVVSKSLWVAVIALFFMILTFMDNNPLSGIWALTFLAFFVVVSALIVAFIFKSRSKKLQTLITGENLLASWTLTDEDKRKYVSYLYHNERSKNKGIFIITTILIVLIFGIFIAVINEGKAAMFLVMIILIALIALFAFGMPKYYRAKNAKGDGNVLIGKKYAYINGYFHNWDFPLSGIKKVQLIQQPFYGIHIKYYYTDRTFTNTEELNIPAPQNIDLQDIVSKLKN